MNQNQKALNHLIDHGYVTQVVATSYGIRRLAARMTDLKNAGVEFAVQSRRDDAGVRYAYYTMTDATRDDERASRVLGGTYNSYRVNLGTIAA